MGHHNVGRNSATHDNNTALSTKKISKLFVDVFVILVTSKVIIANVEIKKLKWLRK
jgi:hypothetical protein